MCRVIDLIQTAITLLILIIIIYHFFAGDTMATVDRDKLVSTANAAFARGIYPELSAAVADDANLVASTFSLATALAMLDGGAAGNTHQQIRTALALPDDRKSVAEAYEKVLSLTKSGEGFTLDAANAVFVQDNYKLISDFLEETTKHFAAEAKNVNFADEAASRAAINSWVEDKTHGKIKDLISKGALTDLTRVVLVNAVYFKADWASKFDKRGTRKGKFELQSGGSVEADLMHGTKEVHGVHSDDLECEVLKMPYKGDRLSMYLFLSDKKEGFKKVEERFNEFDYSLVESKGRKTKYDVAMPRFTMKTTHNLNEALTKVGMTDMFSETKADFSKMSSDKQGLYVSQVVQKAFIEVNEEGTEAAAATGVIMMTRMAVINPRFVLNRPFLFAIRDDKTGVVLFQGRVMDPTKE